ncbi:hypothetical protein ABW20_dc0100594 [Dactylellina cionopaga]|nr:hypothetical protein ABW20_dc0100594 [Dactylellina cionopaga]
MQEGILAQFIRSKGSIYYNAILFLLEEGTDLDKLEHAWKQVAEQNDILRTGFVEHELDGGHYAMVTYKSITGSAIRKIESQLPIEQLVQKYKDEDAQKALSNTALPPWSVTIVSGNGGSHMIFTALHTIYDAQTFHILLNDVNALYHGKQPVIHSSFSPVLKEMLRVSRDKEAIEDSTNYWKSVLGDCPITKFPVMTPLRVDAKEFFVSYQKSSVTMKNVEDLCKKAGFSLGSVGQAAWAKLVAMYFGERDVCFGTVVSGRTGLDSAEDAVFPCLTTVPIRVELNGDNKAVVSQIQGRLRQTLKFQHTPLRAIQKALGQPEQSLFDTIFVYQKSSNAGGNSKALWKELDAKVTVEYPVSFEIEPTDDGYLGFRLTGRTDILPQEQMDTLVSQYEYILLHILQNQEADAVDLGDVPKELLSDTPAEFDRLPCEVKFLHEFVSASAGCYPDKIALEFATAIQGNRAIKDAWTYRQFNDMGNKIANFLLQHGATTGDLVGICFDKTPQAYFGILGILKAGCAFVALDFSAPVQRRSFIVQDANIKIVLTMSQFAGDFDGIDGLQIYSLDNLYTLTKYFSTEEPAITDLTPENLSYVLYTSGTTGTPKGCRITHDNAIQAMLSFQMLFKGHWDEHSRFLQFASLHFDVSVLEQYWSWSVGICMTGAPRDLIFQDIGNAIRALEITHIDLTPSLARLITPEETPSLCRGVFITGGEKLKQDVLDVWGEKGVIYNGYGPTEATIGVTMYPRVPRNGRPSNIGPQFLNVGSMVLKPNTFIPVLRGAVGELCVTGALVGDGYLNREDLSKERFPYINGKRMYRTGDLVRQLHDGCFDYLGRADDQVKLRGQRLELGEINETIRSSDKSVAEIVTLVCQHGQQQVQQLVSFVSFKCDTQGRGSPAPTLLLKAFPAPGLGLKILQACQSRLPVYMVPIYILPITKLPLTVNNKVDERTLRSLFTDTPMDVIQSFEEENNEDGELSETEQIIRDTLTEVSVDIIPAAKNISFFQLGLDSVSIVGFSNKLRKRGFQGVEVSLVMQNPTIASLANALSISTKPTSDDNVHKALQNIKSFSVKHSFEVCSSLNLDNENIETIMPCTPLQEGMIARALNSDVPLYYNTFCFKISQTTTEEALKTAWQQLIDRTDILRTCFCETPEGIAQVILKRSILQWENTKIISKEQLTRPYENPLDMTDLAKPPIRLVYATYEGSAYLRLSIFHALYDGTSMPMILSDIESLLSGGQLNNRMTFAAAVPRILSFDTESAKKFWVDHLEAAEVKPQELKQQNEAMKVRNLSHRVDVSQKNIEKVARDLGCTVQAIFQVACVQALVKLLKKQVVIGMVTSGRSFAIDGIESCIGPLFNSIPCYLPITSGTRWTSYAQAAHNFNTSSVPYHHTPLRQIGKWIGQGSKPIFDVLFVFQPVVAIPGSKILQEIDSTAIPDYPVALEIYQNVDEQYTISITTNSYYIGDSDNALLLTFISTGIADLLSNPDQEVPVLREAGSGIFSPARKRGLGAERPGPQRPTEFTWTKDAAVIRQQLAALTGVSENEIAEKSSIYQIGLDSVEAIRLSSRLQKKGILLKVSDIMRETTIERMVAYLGSLKTESLPLEQSKLTLADFENAARNALKLSSDKLKEVESILPTTPLQDVMIAESIGSDFALYFNHDVLELQTGINIKKLQAAWKTVVKKNPILRTTFEEAHELNLGVPTEYIQIVWKDMYPGWDTVETTSQHEPGRIGELIASHKSRKTPLALGIVHSEKRYLMVLSISHALYDGRSIGMLLEDVALEYSGQSTARPDYKPFLNSFLNLDMKNSTRFWKQLLLGSKPYTFPIGSPDEEIYRAESTSKVLVHDFVQFCRGQQISEPVLGQTCWSILLSDILSQDDIVFGTVVSGRETEESEDYLFPTMNTIPVRAVLHGAVGDVLGSMQHNYSQSLEHQFIALRDVQRSVCEPGQRIFDTLFVYQKNKGDKGVGNLWKSIGGTSQIEYAIAVEMEVNSDSINWRVSASNHVMSADQAQETLYTLDTILENIMKNPKASYQKCTGTTLGVKLQKQFQILKSLDTGSTDERLIHSENDKMLEREIVRAISIISKVDEKGITSATSIFHLGIDSISAIRLASELRRRSIFIAVSEIMRESTVKKMVQCLARKQHQPATSPKPSPQSEITSSQIEKIAALANTKRKDVEDICPATAGQIFLIKAWESSQGRIFLPTFSFKAAEALRPPKLKCAFEGLVSGNPILRTTFVSDEDNIFQIVHKNVSPSFRTTYFDSDLVSESNLHQINREEQSRVYNMSAPSIRAHLVSSRKESYVFITLHHALYDAFTLPILLSQLSNLYENQYLELSAPGKPVIPRSRPETKEFWTAYFANKQSTLLSQKNDAKATDRVELYKEKHVPKGANIDATCRKHGISLHSLSIACFGQVLSKIVRNDNPIFGVYLSNRHLVDEATQTTQTVPMLNMVPLMVKNVSTSSLLQLARQVQNDLLKISTSDAALASTTLLEIYDWTGIRIDSFVNFLREDKLDGSSRDGGLFERFDLTVENPTTREFLIPEILYSTEPIIQTNLDFEMALRGGFVDVGLFASKKNLDEIDLREISEDIKSSLGQFD